MCCRISVILSLCLTTIAGAQPGVQEQPQPARPLNVGDPAPELTLSKVLQAPNGAKTSLPDLRDKIVILHFWGPQGRDCIQAFARLNSLAEKFAGKPVQFISITAVDQSICQTFLDSTPVNGWIGLDRDFWTFSDYSAKPVPHVVIVDRQGKIAAITKPENVTEAVINDLLAGKPIKLPPKQGQPVKPQWKPGGEGKADPEPWLQLAISPCETTDPRAMRLRMNMLGLRVSGYAVPMPVIVALAYQADPGRVLWTLPPTQQLFQVSFAVPAGHELTVYPLFQDALRRVFDLRADWEVRKLPCYVLQRIDDAPWTPPEAPEPGSWQAQMGEGMSWSGDGSIFFARATLADFAKGLENLLRAPVIDETGVDGKYDFSILYKPDDRDALKAALKKMGLKLKKTKRSLKVLVVTPASTGNPS